ncbi:MAG: hypothetical protein AB7G37_00935 [Solirubrobacteraceae bacterium]
MPLVPAPPGAAAGFDDPVAARFAAPHPANRFVVGLFDRGELAQIRSVAELDAHFGGRTNYSGAHDAIATQLREGTTVVTVSRATGPAAVAATVTLMDGETVPADSISVTAKSSGEWANGATGGLKVAVSGSPSAVVLTITEDGVPVAVSPAATTLQELVEWSQGDDVPVLVAIEGVEMPADVAATSLAGGDDDRANITDAEWTTALDRLEGRYGPGLVRAPGVDDQAVHLAIIGHLARHPNRIAFLDMAADVDEAAAIARRLALEAANPEVAPQWALWAQWGRTRPAGATPPRLVSYADAQAGISARVLRELGPGKAPFGRTRGVTRSIATLDREWSTSQNPPGEVQRLYAAHVNTAVDRGQTIATEGYRTGSTDPRYEDLHVATTRMWVVWQGEEIALTYVGEPVNADTIASFAGGLAGMLEGLAGAQAITPGVLLPEPLDDPGYVITTDMNTPATMLARELWAHVLFRPAGSVHWAGVTVGSANVDERI